MINKIFKNNAVWGPILHCKGNLTLCRVASNANIYPLSARYVLSHCDYKVPQRYEEIGTVVHCW